MTKKKPHIILINKIDLDSRIDTTKLSDEYIKISIKDNKGIEELKQKITELFHLEELETDDLTYLSDARSIALLKTSLSYIEYTYLLLFIIRSGETSYPTLTQLSSTNNCNLESGI